LLTAAWEDYVNELNEAKLRALGVSFGEDDPPAPSISPAMSNLSRQPSAQYPPLPFSPPIPTSSASSNHAFAFPNAFGRSSAAQSPGIPAVASPVSFTGVPGKFHNPRQSISFPTSSSPMQQQSPQAWAQQALLMQQGLNRGDSPSLLNMNGMMSPGSPFMEGFPSAGSPAFNMHQRHQSLQYPLLPHQMQLQQPARASPRLQDLDEVDEEALSKSPSKTPEPPRRNRDSLQAEIDDAEYHLEEQLRNQLEHEDYSPHNENEKTEDKANAPTDFAVSHNKQQSVQFAVPEFLAKSSDNGPVLHHPRPHSRGHSLSQNFFMNRSDESSINQFAKNDNSQEDESYEVQTNPSNLGTPVQDFSLSNMLQQHQRGFSTTSNPWNGSVSAASNSGPSRRASHGSKPSLSKLNVEAPEFKFNPTSTFQPGQFVFGSSTFQPAAFQAAPSFTSVGSPSVSQFSFQSGASKINANAPVFSPGQSDFSFPSLGPKFRPDAPSFTPFQSQSGSVTSPVSGSDSAGNRTSSIFGNIDLNNLDIVKPVKKSKAIPIVRPSSRESGIPEPPRENLEEDESGRLVNANVKAKKARVTADDGDEVPLFAEPTEPAELVSPLPGAQVEEQAQESQDEGVTGEGELEERAEALHSGEEDNATPADTTMSSTMVSEPTDAKAATSPSELSPNEAVMNWTPFEFKSNAELLNFNDARPFGEDIFQKGHKKSLSAAAKPFMPGAISYAADDLSDEELEPLSPPVVSTSAPLPASPEQSQAAVARPATPPSDAAASKDLHSSRFASTPPPKPKGLLASRFAASPTPEPHSQIAAQDDSYVEHEPQLAVSQEPISQAPTFAFEEPELDDANREPTFEEIDDVMRQINEEDPTQGVRKSADLPQWHQPSPTRHISLAAVTNSSPYHLAAQSQFRSDAPSPSPQQYHPLPGEVLKPILSTELEDPFLDPPRFDVPVRRLNSTEIPPASDWERDFTDDEKLKLEQRVQYFDGRVNGMVDGLLAERLGPLEKALESIHRSLADMTRRTPSSREQRSVSVEHQLSDADDEDEEPAPRRSMSPRRDKRMEQIRVVVLDALATQQRNMPAPTIAQVEPNNTDAAVLKALEEMKEQFGASMRLDFRGEDLRNIVEDAVERRMPQTPQPAVDHEANEKLSELQAKVIDLEQRLHLEQVRVEKEVFERRNAEDLAAELDRKLQSAETRVEVEIINRSAFDQRVADLEDRLKQQDEKLKQQEDKTDGELHGRRAAEDRLSEVQRLLRISSEEEVRLREAVEEKDYKVKAVEQSSAEMTMRLQLLEAAQTNGTQSQSEMTNRINTLESDLRSARQENMRWKAQIEQTSETAERQIGDFAQIQDENRQLRKALDTLETQLEENERMREVFRGKFVSLQNDMAAAAREIAEDNARRIKNEQTMIARQDTLDAKLQAEARTRERLETEIERLELGERQGLRAVAECKRLEGLLGEMRTENHKLQQTAMHYQREFEEARESGAAEVHRTRLTMQTELDAANHHVNVVREDLEEQVAKVRGDLDQVKLEADTAKAQNEMLLEEAQTNHEKDIEELQRKHQGQMEDFQTRYERQISEAVDDAQKAEQHLLDRLSLSTSRSQHLQQRVDHLEERLEIAKQAALAAAQAAKSASAENVQIASAPALSQPKAVPRGLELPEKISPQALRESIMVLQEQLQDREQRIEELEHNISKLDPEAPTKIAKRDDEITWLRELLAVRHSDLQDIIAALSGEDYDRESVRDATIRLKANLQMEEQERERAINGGSAINITQTLRNAATPRVAQAVGPIAAAWGNWRKNQPTAFSSLSGVLSSPAAPISRHSATPSKSSPASQNSFLGGLLTPPASGLRQTPPAEATKPQPTAFSSTGNRFTAQQMANRTRGPSMSSRRSEKMPMRSPPRREPMTPPMMRASAYDSDANAADFDDNDFFED
jgi:hypothetical protein